MEFQSIFSLLDGGENLMENNNTATQVEVFTVIIGDHTYSLTLQELTELHGQVWTQLHNR